MIEQFHDVAIKEDADGNPIVINWRWRVNHPDYGYNARLSTDDYDKRQQWCVDNLGTGPYGPTWRVHPYGYSVFVNLEDATMFQMV